MRVRIVTTATFPYGQAATSRVRCYAKALISAGDKVTIVAAANLADVPGSSILAHGSYDKIDYVLLRNSARQGRLAQYFWAFWGPVGLCLYTIATTRKFDAVILYFDGVFSNVVLLAMLRVFGKKVLIEMNEYPYSTDGSRIVRLPLVRRLLQKCFLRLVMPMSNGFLVISDSLSEVVERFAPSAAVLKVPILSDNAPDAVPAPKCTGEEIYLFHAGSLSEQKDGISKVFQAFAIAHHKLRERYNVRLKLYLTTKMTHTATWRNLADFLAREDLTEEVVVTGYCSEVLLNRYLRGSLALVINKPENLQNSHNFPTRLGGYLASSRPVILAAADCEANKYLLNDDNAFVVAPNDTAAMAEAIIRCYEDPEAAWRIGGRGLETYLRHFHFGAQAKRLSEFINALK